MRLRGRLAAIAVLTGAWLLASGPAAAAHGALQSSEPAGGSSLERAPAAVTLRFTERPDPELSTVRVLDNRARVVAGGPAQPVPGRPEELRVPVAGLPDGGYTVAWRIVSAVDGHRTDGVFGFGVGPAGAAPQLPPSQAVAEVRTGPALAPLAVAGRWAWYWGLALLVGAAATGLLVFGGRLPGRPALLLGLALAAAAAGLLAMTAAARADAGVPLTAMLGSTTGHWLLWRAALLAAATVAASWWALTRPAPGDPPAPAAVAGDPTPSPAVAGGPPAPRPALGARLTLPTRGAPLVALGLAGAGGMLVHALAGHAAAPTSLRALNLIAQWAHLLAVGVWIGGLAWLLAGLWQHASTPSAREVVVRFSKLAGISLAVVVVTGVARTVDELGGWARLADSGFGRAMDLTLMLFAWLVALGAVNHYRLVPLFEAGGRRRAVSRLRRSVGGELGLAAAVLAAAALLSQLAPGLATGAASSARPVPATPPALAASGADWATTVKVTLTVTPGPAGPNRFTAVVADYDSGTVLPVDRVELSGTPADHPDLGTARIELSEAADGRWLGQGRMLSLAGRWNLTTTIQRPTGGITVPLALDVPPPAPS